jgi:phage terminase large subunit-like protein
MQPNSVTPEEEQSWRDMPWNEFKDQFQNLASDWYTNLEKIERYKASHGSEFFQPYPYQQEFISLAHKGKKRIYFQGANQTGKTLTGSALVDSFANGVQAWDKKPSVFDGRPTDGRIIVANWDIGQDVIVKKLKKIVIGGTYTTKSNGKCEYKWTFRNGSQIIFMTHEQAQAASESFTADWAWADEQLPQDAYEGICRGLMAHNGVFLFTFTALAAPWMLDEICLNTDPMFGGVANVDIEDNLSLSREVKDNFAASLREDQKIARLRGGWFQLAGLVVKGFNPDLHLIDLPENEDIPPTWPVTAVIDLELVQKIPIGYYAVDPLGYKYVIDETFEHLSPSGIGYDILRKRDRHSWSLKTAHIDILARGDANYLRNRNPEAEDTFTILENILDREGIELHGASKDRESGVRNINEWIAPGQFGQPLLHFVRGRTEQHVHEIQRWVYVKGRFARENPGMMENLYRFTLLGMRYDENNYTHFPHLRKSKRDPGFFRSEAGLYVPDNGGRSWQSC